MKYICPACSHISDEKDWDEETLKRFSEITPLSQATDTSYFYCPNCQDSVTYHKLRRLLKSHTFLLHNSDFLSILNKG